MTQSLHPAAQKGFSSAAELYQQVRPGYPQDIVNWLQDQLQLGEKSHVIDLGSGTGKFLSRRHHRLCFRGRHRPVP